MKKFLIKISPKLPQYYRTAMLCFVMSLVFAPVVFASSGGDMWSVAKDIIKNVYNQIAGISTILAGLMSAVAVVGAKMSNNQHKTDQSWDWLKRIWICWLIINGIGAFIAYVSPLLQGWNNLDGTQGSTGSNP